MPRNPWLQLAILGDLPPVEGITITPLVFVPSRNRNQKHDAAITSAEYQWNSTVLVGVKLAAIKARYASRIVTLPEPSSINTHKKKSVSLKDGEDAKI